LPDGWKDLPAEDQARLKSVGRVISEAQKRLRDGEVSPELLKQLGMTQREFNGFVEKYASRLKRKGGADPDTPDRNVETVKNAFRLAGRDGRQTGKDADASLAAKGLEEMSKDEIRELYQRQGSKVPPRFRQALEEYYRSLSEETSPAKAPQPPR